MKFYKCKNSNEIIIKIKENESCCMNDNFIEINANTCDASKEKHIPVVSFSNNLMNICIGSDLHPMVKEHFIDWVFIEYPNGGEFIYLHNEPNVVVSLLGREVKRVYAYCNQHGLWVRELN